MMRGCKRGGVSMGEDRETVHQIYRNGCKHPGSGNLAARLAANDNNVSILVPRSRCELKSMVHAAGNTWTTRLMLLPTKLIIIYILLIHNLFQSL